MATSLFTKLAASINRLSKRVDSQPAFNEATITTPEPLYLVLDGDTNQVPASRSLDSSLSLGDRVLTVTINGFIWVIGKVGGDGIPVGTILEFGGATAPTGFLLLDGTPASRTEHARLFAVYGTTYGEGDGETTFGLPDHAGRAAVQVDPLVDEFNTLGKVSGARTHTLTTAQLPSHSHGVAGTSSTGRFVTTNRSGNASPRVAPAAASTGQAHVPGYGSSEAVGSAGATETTGLGDAHNNIQPSIAMNFIVKY